MKNPAYRELMEYCDGRTSPERTREIEQLIAGSRRLQQEVQLLRSLQHSVQKDVPSPVPVRLKRNIMTAVLSEPNEAWWYRAARSSSGLFAMALVLAMIGIAVSSGAGAEQRDPSMLSTTIDSYRTVYDGAVDHLSAWSVRSLQPINHAASSPFGRFLLIGLAVFVLFIVVDEVIGKRLFHRTVRR